MQKVGAYVLKGYIYGIKELKVCNSLCKFKKMYTNKVINDYMTV